MPTAKPDFSQRADLIEKMDEPCSYGELRACLHDIARVNRLTSAYRPVIEWLEKIVAASPSESLRIVDVGCGYGDTLRTIEAWSEKSRIPVMLTGIDLNPDAIRAAREATHSNRIEWVVGDALSNSIQDEIDIVISSLLTHHLTNPQIIQFLEWMEQRTRRGWFINDLHRQPVPYGLFSFLARFTNWHPFVKYDGPVSIRRSFRTEDWKDLTVAAGLAPETVAIREFRPARLCVSRIK
ncbi:MAG TPA: methyltransferase domain-containing protein [Edaphobacter sp.]|jgi:SAM-dependent methyltransferase|nr:methyltransferase domain-containing protein [Edaphobacter sp.]